MKILITGSRYWNTNEDWWKINNVLHDATVATDILIAGGAPGVDTLAAQWARTALPNRRCLILRAQWDIHGKAAGPIRNREMLDLQPDIVIAFHDNLAQSKGTKDCVEEAVRRGIPVAVYE